MSRFMKQAIAIALMGTVYEYSNTVTKSGKKLKQCANPNCNKTHTHNNRWCSSECCKEDRSMKQSNKIFTPNYNKKCGNCDQIPTVKQKVKGKYKNTGMCGPCFFGTAKALDEDWWNS